MGKLNSVTLSRLQAELRQNKPFRSRAQEATLSIFRTSDLLGRCGSQVTHPHGLSGEQYNVLRILRGAGQGGLPTLEVAERLVVHNPAITRLLDKLEAKRLVVRRRCDRDRRRVYCEITTTGLELLGRLDKPMDEIADTVHSGVSQEDLAALIRILEQIRSGADSFICNSLKKEKKKSVKGTIE